MFLLVSIFTHQVNDYSFHIVLAIKWKRYFILKICVHTAFITTFK